MTPRASHLAAVAALLLGGCGTASAQAGKGSTLLPGASARDPVSIDAGKLDYFDKEQKLVYTGDVRAKQGESSLRGSVLTIFLAKDPAKAGDAAAGAGGLGQGGTSVRRMEVTGPVTVVSKDEVGTGDNGVYDKAANAITLTGNVTLSQGTNVIKGDTLTYNMTSGQARVSGGPTQGRVTSVFTPGSGGPAAFGGAPAGGKGKTKRGGGAGKGAPPPPQASR